MKTHGPESGQPFVRSMVDVPGFLARVDRSNETGCWPWTGRRASNGYGCVSVSQLRPGPVHAHRVAYVVAHGSIPRGKSVRHSCDNPICVNPAHLSLGTQLDNMRDKVARGRSRNGNDAKTHCKYGHPFDTANTIVRAGARICRVCRERNLAILAERNATTRAEHSTKAQGAFNTYFARHISPVTPASFNDLLDMVDDRRATIFARFFGLYGFAPTTGESLGSEFGVTRERARQLRNDVLYKLGITRAVISAMPTTYVWKVDALIATRTEVEGRVA